MGLHLLLDEELKKAGVKLIFCLFTRSDGPEGKLTETIMAAAAEYEREKFLERSWRGKNSRAKDGLVMVGGAIPYGYTYIHADGKDSRGYLKVDPVEAEVVKQIFHLRLQGYGVWRIVKMLFAEGIPTKADLGQSISPKSRAKGVWSTSTVHRMLRNTAYVGKLYWNKNQFFEPDEAKRRKPANLKRLKTASKANPKDQWFEIAVEPIIEPTVFEAVQRLMDNAKTTNPRRRIHEYLLLAGRLKCGRCGSSMSGYYDGKKRARRYRCTSSRHNPNVRCYAQVKASYVEDFVWMVVKESVLDEPEAFRERLIARLAPVVQLWTATVEHLEAIGKDIEKRRHRLRRYQEMLADDDISQEEYRERKTEIGREIASLEKIHAEMQGQLGQTQRLQEDIQYGMSFVDHAREMPMDGIADQRKVIELLRVMVTYHDKQFDVRMHLLLPEDPSITSELGRG